MISLLWRRHLKPLLLIVAADLQLELAWVKEHYHPVVSLEREVTALLFCSEEIAVGSHHVLSFSPQLLLNLKSALLR